MLRCHSARYRRVLIVSLAALPLACGAWAREKVQVQPAWMGLAKDATGHEGLARRGEEGAAGFENETGMHKIERPPADSRVELQRPARKRGPAISCLRASRMLWQSPAHMAERSRMPSRPAYIAPRAVLPLLAAAGGRRVPITGRRRRSRAYTRLGRAHLV